MLPIHPVGRICWNCFCVRKHEEDVLDAAWKVSYSLPNGLLMLKHHATVSHEIRSIFQFNKHRTWQASHSIVGGSNFPGTLIFFFQPMTWNSGDRFCFKKFSIPHQKLHCQYLNQITSQLLGGKVCLSTRQTAFTGMEIVLTNQFSRN